MVANKLKEINIKRCTYYYWNSLININDLDFENIMLNKNHTKILLFMILDIKYHIV